jgi:hypothetical protein
MGEATAFVDTVAKAARASEVPNASFENGCNQAGSNAHGIGINMNEGAVVGTAQQFTQNDQAENPRTPQSSQYIGGFPYVNRSTTPWPTSGGTSGTGPDKAIQFGSFPTAAQKAADSSLDGTITIDGECALLDVSAGWLDSV